VQFGIAPVRRHLASAGTGVVGCANALQEHVVRLHPERQAQGAVAVVRIEPVVSGLQRQAGGEDRKRNGSNEPPFRPTLADTG